MEILPAVDLLQPDVTAITLENDAGIFYTYMALLRSNCDEKLQTMIFDLRFQNKEKHKTKLNEICRDYSLPSETSFVQSILIK